MRERRVLLIALFCVGFISCIKQAPQLPSNKVIQNNNDGAVLLKINSNLTKQEDERLTIIAQKAGSFKKNNLGFWYQIFRTGKGESIADSSLCKFDYQLFKTNGKLINSGQNTIVIGKKQSITGLEEGLKMMHKGDSASFIIPWYLAYGMTGYSNFIPPYTSLIYKIRLNN